MNKIGSAPEEKKQNVLPYTTILHQVREYLGITMEDYCVADSIYHLSANPDNKIKGWCFASKKYISDFIRLNERYVFRSIKKLIEKNLVEKDEATKHIRTTKLWYDLVVMPKAKIEYDKMSEGMTKCHRDYDKMSEPLRQNVIGTMTKCQSYNNTYNEIYKKNTPSPNGEEAKPADKQYGNPEINECVSFFKAELDGELDDSVAGNRRYAKLLLDKFRKAYPDTAPVDNVQALIRAARKDKFHKRNATSFKYLYYNAQKIIQAKKSCAGNVAII